MKNALAAVNQPETGVREPVSEGVNFGETIGASFAYKYAPIANFFEVGNKFGFASLPENGYTARDNIPDDLKAFGSTLLSATNSEHMTLLVGQIRNGQKNREISYRSGFVANFAAEFFDPVNYIALPFSKAKTFGQAVLKTGSSTAAVVSAQEAIRYPLDPLGTKGEVALNIGASFVLGGLLGGAIGTPARNRVKAQEHGAKQIKLLREAIEPIDGVELDPNIAQSIFTDSWLFTAVTTPMKRVLMDQSVPNSVKIRTLAIANDSGILLAGNKKGQKFGNSVFQEAKLHEGEWVSVHDDLMEIWGRTTGDGVTSPMDYMPKRKEFNNWLAGIDEKAIRRTTPANDLEASAIKKLNSFYENWEVRLRDEGMIGSRKFYEGFVAKREAKLAGVQKRLTAKVSPEHRSRLEAQVTRYSDEIDEAKQTIQDLKDAGPITPPNEGVFRPRYWDFDYIRANRDEFTQVLTDWFSANPSIYARNTKSKKFERIDLSSDKQSISKRVNDMINGLLDDTDPLNPDGMYYGMGKSKHMKHRTLDIPNELVLNFMVRNPVSVMKAYVSKTAARYEFSRKFNGESIDDILDDTFSEMMVAGSNAEQAHAVMKDMRHLYDRVAGTVLRSPDALNQKTATIMRDLAQLNYLGSAGLSTITEPAKIIMEHGLGPTMKGLFNVLTDNQLKLGAKEVRVAGESLENLMGNAHMRLVEDLNNNPLRTTYMDKTKNAFYMLNGLGPITRILKDFDGMMRSHTLIDYSVRWTQGKASKMEREYLLRYNINLEDAHKIANAPWQKSSSGMYMANTEAWTNTIEFPSTRADIVSGPTNSFSGNRYKPAFYRESENKIYIDEEYILDTMWEQRGWEKPRQKGVTPIESGIINSPEDLVTFVKMHEIMHTIHSAKALGFDKLTKAGRAGYENAINDLAVVEIKQQARVDPETVKTFRNALSSGVLNTILMGTPADKPIITDGIVYIPMRVAKQFGMKEDSAYKGYARIENGLLGLPFQFFSYALAAVNKTTAAYGHGQLKSQYIGTAIAMGLGYMSLQIKTPDYVEMSYSDQFARSFDYSGVATIYSDMFYTAMNTVSALGGPNITGGLLQPKFPQKPSTLDAATGLLGAGPSISTDLARGMYELTTGNVGKGSGEIIRNLPFARLWFLKSKINEMTNMLESELDGPTGLGRF